MRSLLGIRLTSSQASVAVICALFLGLLLGRLTLGNGIDGAAVATVTKTRTDTVGNSDTTRGSQLDVNIKPEDDSNRVEPSRPPGFGDRVGATITAAPASSTPAEVAAPSNSPSPSPSARQRQRIAVGVRMSTDWMPKWRDLLLKMKVRKDIALFISIWRGDIDQQFVQDWMNEPESPLVSVKAQPGGTWTVGRNWVAESIYEQEVKRGARYDYWSFVDGDAWFVDCHRCPETRPPDYTGAACCLDYLYNDVVLGNYTFATVSTILAREEYPNFEGFANDPVIDKMFFFRDCGDGQLQAFHRDAVPLLLPLHHELDDVSWWSSQGLLFRYTTGCMPSAHVLPGKNLRFYMGEHIPYNRGDRDVNREAALVRDTFPQLADFPLNAASNPHYYNCLPGIGPRTLDPAHPDVVDWRSQDGYKKCMQYKEPWFVEKLGKGVPQAPRR